MTVKEAAPIIKATISSRQMVEHYGYQPDRGGYIPCPFHHEADPSLKVHRSGWYCYGCNKGGDVIDFVREHDSVSFAAAVRKIDSEFSLGLVKPEKVSVDEFLRKRKDKRRQEALELLSKAERLAAEGFIRAELGEAWESYRAAYSVPAERRNAAEWWTMVAAREEAMRLEDMLTEILSGCGQKYVDQVLDKYGKMLEEGSYAV